ncbi:MAG TPA: hypothetical protein VF735_10985 [Pyrinomonadaceae bacterium]|jgi:hypothetical protein
MKRSFQLLTLALLLGLASIQGLAQTSAGTADDAGTGSAAIAASSSTPQTVRAKYEGGVFGHNKKQEGTLSFDDANRRLLFRDNKQRELLFIPYEAVTSAFADTQSKRPRAATIASSIPTIFTLPARFIKTKVRYLTLQFSDPDSQVSGVTSFRLKDKETLTSVLNTLARKASLTPRGEVFVRSRKQGSSQQPNP